MIETPSLASSRYRFVRRLATGGMAELYLGEASGVGGVSNRCTWLVI